MRIGGCDYMYMYLIWIVQLYSIHIIYPLKEWPLHEP
jgi:hypothetical protein